MSDRIDLLEMTFESCGYRVEAYRGGEEFKAVARKRVPACVVLDVCMPGQSGLEILKELDAHS
jgi:two-component system, LuxR family, response regulator FixJ